MSIYTEKLESVNRDSPTPKEFTDAFELANKYRKNGEFEKAKKVYLEIKKDDDEYNISHANYYLGIISAKEKSYDDSINYLSEVNKDCKDIYSKSQYLLGLIFRMKSNFDDAVKHFKEVNKGEISEFYYYRSKYILGELYRDYLNNKEQSKRYFQISKKYFYYEAKKEILCMSSDNNAKIISDIYKSVTDILKNLKVGSDESEYEKCVAHYTSPTVALKLLDEGATSYLRLNTVKNVNDPTEGKVLKEYLNIPSLSDSKRALTLISCFTFNHDSLNQFRLYGKENNLEASGVSIVFKNDFFNNQEDRINFIGNVEEPFIGSDEFIEKLPLYRCIYIDPYQKSKYINIAQRGKITFYRDGKESDIKKYLNYIESKKKKVIKNLDIISKNIKKLSFEDANYKKEVIDFLLLPIYFLVKHAAFEDEQECRIIYLTDLKNKNIKTEDNKLMYLDYEHRIKNYIHKIYLSSGAYKYEDFFIRLLHDKQDVCLSKNPFRNKP